MDVFKVMKKYGGIILLAMATLFAMGVGADFASYDADRSVHVAVVADDQELINLKPVQPYEYIDQDGKLVIDISKDNDNWQSGLGQGISPDAKYAFDCMFEVSNDLLDNVTINVTVTSSNTLVKLYLTQSDNAGTTVNFDVEPGEAVCV